VFDPNTIRDLATFEHAAPVRRRRRLVVVNGQIAFEDGKMTRRGPVRVLYGPARK